MEFYLAQLSGGLAWAFLLYSYWKNGNNKIIYLQLFSCIFFATNYFLLGAFSGLLVVVFEIFRDYLYAKVKNPMKVFYICIPFYIIISIFSFENIISLFSVLASICDSYALTKKNKRVVILGILTYSLWLVYDIFYASYGTLIAEVFLIISNILVLIKYRIAYQRVDKINFTRCLYLNNEQIKKIYNLDSGNYNLEYIRDKELNLKMIKNKKIDYISIMDEDDIIGYINFIFIDKKTFEKMKNSKTFIDIKENEIKRKKFLSKNYININSIVIQNNYQNEKTIDLVCKQIKKYVKDNNKKGYRINSLICIALSEFEINVLEKLNFEKLNKEVNIFYIYVSENKNSFK